MFTSKKISGSRHYLASVLAAAIALGGSGLAFGQVVNGYVPTYTPAPSAPPVQAYSAAPQAPLTADQLDQLLAPIALYPDPLLAQVLAASTYPQDITNAAQWLQSYPSPTDDQINAQPWDPSVKAIVHFPNVINMLASQMDWTESLGAAFANQQQDVMDSVQRLRSEAQQANTLVTNQQQQVVGDAGDIQILPAQADEIYVPEYDPTVVYAPGGYIDFGVGCAIDGDWFDLGWDWRNHGFDRGYHWNRGDWSHPRIDRNPPHWVHDSSRPMPAPHFTNVRPHGVEPARGWGNAAPNRGAPAFDSHSAPRPGSVVNPHPVMRPVNGLQPHPVVQPHAAPVVAPHAEPLPHFENRPAVVAPHNEPVVRPVERPVVGLPARPPVVERPAPIPVRPAEPERPAPVIEQRPTIVAPPAPAFHMEPSANVHVQSERGNASVGGGGGGGRSGKR